MVPPGTATAPTEALTGALRSSLRARPGGEPRQADRLACLLRARAEFEAAVGEPPGDDLAEVPPPFEGFDVPAVVRDALAGEVASADDSRGDTAAIGDGYEQALPTTDRGRYGQYYTPRPVATALVRWALDAARADGEPTRVLDPAVGTGTFLVSALQQLTERYPDRGPSHLLSRLVGVDVDPGALHLAGLRLAATAGTATPSSLALHHGSFFDVEPADGGAAGAVDTLESVDAVVGNPPFVRAEGLQPGPEHYRRHLATFGPPGETPWLDGPDALSRRSDAYVYFVTHATRFLRPGGRLALVLPTKWLMSAYGEDLRRFLRTQYRIHAVVGFEGRAFDALVDTALLFAERDVDAAPTAPIRFAQLEAPTAPDRVLAAVDRDSGESPAIERRQRALTDAGSLARYLDVPAALLELFDTDAFVRLDTLAEVARGTMTGANQFFFVDEADVKRYDLGPQLRRPAVKSLRSVDRPVVGATDPDRWLIDVHPVVEAVTAELLDGADPEAAVKATLADRGHEGLLAYVVHAEREGWHEGRTCQSRAVWFDLGDLRAPAAFVPKLLRDRVFAIRNQAGAVPSNAIDGVWPHSSVHTGALLAALNASVGKAAMEVTGRDEAGLLQLMTYETASLPTLDVRQLDPSTAREMAAAGAAYAADPGPATRRSIDRSIDDGFDLPLAGDRLRELADSMRCQRVDGSDETDGRVD